MPWSTVIMHRSVLHTILQAAEVAAQSQLSLFFRSYYLYIFIRPMVKITLVVYAQPFQIKVIERPKCSINQAQMCINQVLTSGCCFSKSTALFLK